MRYSLNDKRMKKKKTGGECYIYLSRESWNIEGKKSDVKRKKKNVIFAAIWWDDSFVIIVSASISLLVSIEVYWVHVLHIIVSNDVSEEHFFSNPSFILSLVFMIFIFLNEHTRNKNKKKTKKIYNVNECNLKRWLNETSFRRIYWLE